MIGKHIRPLDRKTGKFGTGPMDRAAARRLAAYIMRLSSGGFEVCNDFGPGDPSGICDVMEELLSRGNTACWGRHMLLSWPEGDTCYDGHEPELVEAFKKKTGAKWVLCWRHNDKAHAHLHMFVLEIDERFKSLKYRDGKKNIAQLLRELAVELEDQYGGTKTGRTSDRDVVFTKNEMEEGQRLFNEGRKRSPAPDKADMIARLESLIQTSVSLDDLVANAAAQGIEVRISRHDNGRGVSFSSGGRSYRGRELGWSYGRLAKHYEQNGRQQGDGGAVASNEIIRGRGGRPTGPDGQVSGDPAGGAGEARAAGRAQPAQPERIPPEHGQRRVEASPLTPLIKSFQAMAGLSWFMRAFIRLCMSVDRSSRQQYYDELRRDRALDLPKL